MNVKKRIYQRNKAYNKANATDAVECAADLLRWIHRRYDVMANYIAFEKEPAKKKGILTKREDELRHALRNDLQEPKIVKIAERVRRAKLGVLKGQRHCAQIYRGDDDPSRHRHLDNIDKEYSKWSSMSVQEIVEMYQ